MNRSDLQRLIASAQSLARDRDSDAVLFLGSPTDPVPRALIVDTDLPFAARILWCYLRSLSDSPGSAAISPSYRDLQKELGISNRSAVGDYLKTLQITRWISVVSQGGPKSRRVYVIYDMPLTFEQAVDVDADYASGIEKAMEHPKTTIRSLAQRVLDGAIRSSGSHGPGNDIYRLAGFAGHTGPSQDGEVVDMWSGVYQRLHPDESREDPEPPTFVPSDSDHDDPDIDLVFHDRILCLSRSMKELASLTLKRLPPRYRQLLLDDLAANVLQRSFGNDPIRSPLRYLQWMVNEYTERGELPLSGKGEDLEKIVSELDRKQMLEETRPLRDELQKLMAHSAHLERMIGYSRKDLSEEGDRELEGLLHDNKAKIEELQQKIGEATSNAP